MTTRSSFEVRRRATRKRRSEIRVTKSSVFARASPAYGMLLQRGAVVLPHPTVMAAVGKIDHHANHKPNDQPCPIDPSEFVHHIAVEEYPHHRHKRNPRRSERARLARIGLAEDQ